MEKLLEGRVAVVTGSGQGVGRALALGLAAAGAKVVTNNRKPGDSRSAMVTDEQFQSLSPERQEWYLKSQQLCAGDAETTAEAIRDAGGEATAFFGDISDFETAKKLIDTAVDTYGRIDILCNIAGAFGFSDIDEITEELWDRVIRVKMKGSFNTMRHAVPHMKKQGYGRIINASSRAFMGDVLKHAEYCAANAGVVGLTRAAAMELREYGITCNAFSPFARTRASYEMEVVEETQASPLTIGNISTPKFENTPLPEKIVPFLVYLSSEYGADISGSMFSLAGNKIQLHQEPVICKTLLKPGSEPWTMEELATELPKSIFNGYRSIAD